MDLKASFKFTMYQDDLEFGHLLSVGITGVY